MSLNGINWTGLLAWSTNYHDSTRRSQFTAMSKEDREWLEAALKSVSGASEDPNVVLKSAIEKLQTITDRGEVLGILKVIDGTMDYPDCPRNFEKFNGTSVLLKTACDFHPFDEASEEAFAILSIVFANNLDVQTAAVDKYNAAERILEAVINSKETRWAI